MEIIAPNGIPKRSTVTAAPRMDKLQGKRIALLDNSKVNCTPLLAQVQVRLEEKGSMVIRLMKPTAGKPISAAYLAEIQDCDAMITGLGD
jgi:hypothetical protein